MRWMSGLTGRQRLRVLLPWLIPWLVINILWVCGLESRFHTPWADRFVAFTQFLLVGAILSLAWRERKFRKPAGLELKPDQR